MSESLESFHLTPEQWVEIDRTQRARQVPPTLYLSLYTMQQINAIRCKRWHSQPSQKWSGLEWAGAMCGEAGEAANVAKKLRRFEQGLDGNQSSERQYADTQEMVGKLAEEIADTILYAMLLASHYGINVERAVVDKFNAKSIAQGFPERFI